jgi:hypothetical protein
MSGKGPLGPVARLWGSNPAAQQPTRDKTLGFASPIVSCARDASRTTKSGGALESLRHFRFDAVRPARTGALHHSTRRHPLRRRALRFGLVRDYALRR